MITHSRETYQPTSIMRWDRGIFNGSCISMINEKIYEMEIRQLTQLCVNMCQHMCQCWLIYIYLHKSPSIRYEWIYLPNLSPGQGQDCCHWSLILKQLRNGRNLTLAVDVSWKWLNYVEFYFFKQRHDFMLHMLDSKTKPHSDGGFLWVAGN